ncbi:AtpZ/AtpI family protein [Thiocapsa imhoffii]|nr:AtpZ/AtpI family protein [Thiocapsa imhoffii]
MMNGYGPGKRGGKAGLFGGAGVGQMPSRLGYLKVRRDPTPGVWFGLGMIGLIGWSVVVPTLLGAALGLWLDAHYPASHSWTLALLVAGLTLGCFNAWNSVTKEERAVAGGGGEHSRRSERVLRWRRQVKRPRPRKHRRDWPRCTRRLPVQSGPQARRHTQEDV